MKSKNSISLYITLFVIGSCGVLSAQQEQVDTVAIELEFGAVKHIGYGTQRTSIITSAISTVSGSELGKSFTSNLANTLYGRLPGLTVVQGSGEPGNDSPSLYARGRGSFVQGSSVYLLMVDGYESSFERLSPDEIETISLLKDASATAIYGSRGANGVLLVTTKRGIEGPLVVDFSTQQGFQQASKSPEFLGSYDYARLFNEGLENDGNPIQYTPEDLEAYRNNSDPFFRPNVNWYNEVLRKSVPISRYNLNFRGGNNTVRYFVSLNALTNQGLYIKAGDLDDESVNPRYTRYNVRSNIDLNITKGLSASLSLGGIVEDQTNPFNNIDNPTSNYWQSLASLPPNSFPVYNEDGSFAATTARTNPLADILRTGSYTSNSRTLQSTFRLTQNLDKLVKGLNVSGAVSLNSFFKAYSKRSKQYQSFRVTRGVGGELTYQSIGQTTSITPNDDLFDQWRNLVFQGFVNYDRTFGNHNVSAMVMYNADTYTNISSATTEGNLSLPYNHMGGGGRFTYVNNDKYIAEFSFGYMGSENFPEGSRFGFFPAMSLGWVASEESFLKGNKVIDYLKIRGSYGLTGNDKIGNNTAATRFLFDQRYPGVGAYYYGPAAQITVNGIHEGTLANPDVTWEKDRKFNVGMELNLLSKFDVVLDVFSNTRYDILAVPNDLIPQYIGILLPQLNVGEVRNNGFEATVRYTGGKANQLQYFVEAGAWHAKNEIIKNSQALQLYDYQYQRGHEIGQPFGLEAIGLFVDQNEINSSPTQIFDEVQPGDVRYKDQNDDGVIDQNDAVPIGRTSVPTTTFSLHAGVQYRGFDLDMLFQGVTGVTSYLGESFHAFQNNGQITPMALDRWTPETAQSASYPRLSAENNLNNYRFSSFWQRDGSFVKLRSLEVGYTLPQKLIGKFKLTRARVFVNGTNLFSIDDMDGLADPETSITGYPALRTLSLGAQLKF